MMKHLKFLAISFITSISLVLEAQPVVPNSSAGPGDPAEVFNNPPESAKPGVLWMWMGSNISREGITRDLEALKKAGFNRTTMFSLADITTSLAGEIGKSPTPEIISWTEPWWKMVRHAAVESKRLGMDFGMFNGPGYETSGGIWITPEQSMQEICWSMQVVHGNSPLNMKLERPQVNPRANHPFAAYNRETLAEEIPVIPARKTFYKDIAVLAVPADGAVNPADVIVLTENMQSDGLLHWDAPAGKWYVYRFGHTTTGALVFPTQWKATGLECDKMSQEAVDFHLNHIITEIQSHLGDLIGASFTHLHFDSYEAGKSNWTPKMQAEFLKRRGYDLTPYLISFAGRKMGSTEDSLKFRNDFDATIKDLYRDVYFTTISKKLRAANLIFSCEPYGGPWRPDEVMPLVQNVMTEFFTSKGVYSPYKLDETVAALRKSGQNIIDAEAFTGPAVDSRWTETPAWLKPIGDAAFCAGVNRLVIHRFVQQPWDERYQPGATMGIWGTHFDRTQTWWESSAAMVRYWQRCQALLQWGKISAKSDNDFMPVTTEGNPVIKFIHRTMGKTDLYFVANTSHNQGWAKCTFDRSGMHPELWNPVTGTMRDLSEFENSNGKTSVQLKFDDAQSYFVVFRKPFLKDRSVEKRNFPSMKEVIAISGPWEVKFDPKWGGPEKPVIFSSLVDWINRSEPGIKYFSGTAIYKTSFNMPSIRLTDKQPVISLELGVVKHIARVMLNNQDLGVVWTAPWSMTLPPGILKKKGNRLEIKISNVWVNRLIGDEQEPADCEWLIGGSAYKQGYYLKEFPEWFLKNQPRPSKNRYCFTTWNYFTRESPLISSGLLGPVKLVMEE
jgi:hypothetical protein